jgi:hypothetical protein
MDNSFFILSKQKVRISRFHICTWDIESSNTFIELGVEFNFPKGTQEVEFKMVVPFVDENSSVCCLLQKLITDTENCKFIFNDNIKSFSYFDNSDKRSGGIVTFETRENKKLKILPVASEITENNVISLKVKNENPNEPMPSYIRFLIKSNLQTFARIKKGIAKTDFIFDIKLNEKRNLPNSVYDIKDKYNFCEIENCFCFHVIPISYNISFIDQTKLKNIRELEVLGFKKYLREELKTMKEGKYMIVFNKDTKQDSYSFFTIFTKETIGSKQILFAIGANIFCSLLFGISVIRTSFNSNSSFWKQIPAEYWIAIVTLIILIVFLFIPCKAFFKIVLEWIRNMFRK